MPRNRKIIITVIEDKTISKRRLAKYFAEKFVEKYNKNKGK